MFVNRAVTPRGAETVLRNSVHRIAKNRSWGVSVAPGGILCVFPGHARVEFVDRGAFCHIGMKADPAKMLAFLTQECFPAANTHVHVSPFGPITRASHHPLAFNPATPRITLPRAITASVALTLAGIPIARSSSDASGAVVRGTSCSK
jgi:hypothetical protein